MIRHVSQRFRHVSKMSLLWKEFIWHDYKPHHVCSVSKVLEEHGEHVRRIFFPAHLMPTQVLKMVCDCTLVTHLSLPRYTQVTLDDLKNIVHILTRLHQLDVFADDHFIQRDGDSQHIKGLLSLLKNTVKELKLHVVDYSEAVIESITEMASQGYHLPIINIFADCTTFSLLPLWEGLHSNHELLSFEISLYDDKPIAMNLYPHIPLEKFKFGSSASVAAHFILLNHYGMIGLKRTLFHLSEYDSCGTVKHTLTQVRKKYFRRLPILYTSHLDSVYYIDFSKLLVRSNHLEQLAIMCPNLQRLNLQENTKCLEDLRGLRAIVHTCQNLEGLNLTGVSVSRVESYVLLWELLSSLKRLTHLAIDLCLVKPDNTNKEKLISMFKSCQSLKALEISRDHIKGCMHCTFTTDFWFSYFPSLTYCRMYGFRFSALTYAITNCRRLRYLYEKDAREESLLPLSNNCHLQQLCIYSLTLNPTDKLVAVLSVNGQLERVVLHIQSITIDGIVTIINNSPNLILLHISMIKPLCDEGLHADTIKEIKEMFSYRKLFAVGSFSVRVVAATVLRGMRDADLADTDLNSLWASPI